MKNMILALSLFFLLQGCATTLRLDPIASDGQQEIFQEGVKTLFSTKQSLVAIRPSTSTYLSTQRPTMVVSVLNGTETPFNFSTEDIMVFADGQPVRVFSYDELIAEIRTRQAWAALSVAMSGAAQSMNAANAGRTYHSGTYNTGYGYGSYSGYSYNPGAVQQAQAAANAQTIANMNVIKSQTDQALTELSATILKKTTVFPQMLHGGYIKLEYFSDSPSVNNVVVKVNAGGEIHEFKFSHIKVTQTPTMPTRNRE
jgi:hypothetical protein